MFCHGITETHRACKKIGKTLHASGISCGAVLMGSNDRGLRHKIMAKLDQRPFMPAPIRVANLGGDNLSADEGGV